MWRLLADDYRHRDGINKTNEHVLLSIGGCRRGSDQETRGGEGAMTKHGGDDR